MSTHPKQRALRAAIRECQRFITFAEALEVDPDEYKWIRGTRLTGATKRASLDATRALADYRHGSVR